MLFSFVFKNDLKIMGKFNSTKHKKLRNYALFKDLKIKAETIEKENIYT